MAVPYPFALRTLLASKSRTQPAAFAMAQPRRGFAYIQATGTDTPVFWDVSFRFDQFDAIRFQLWFTQLLQRGILEFTLPIQTEFGLIDHVCRFLPDGLGDCQQDGMTWIYSAKIMARAQVIPQAYIGLADLIAGMPNWNEWMIPLDIGLSEFVFPQPDPVYSGPSLVLDFTDQLYRMGDWLPSYAFSDLITFTRASTATRTNSQGLLELVASGVPRIDFDPVTLECKGLLIEEARTNLLTYSEQFDNAAWNKLRASVTPNAATAPDGTLAADKLVENTVVVNSHYLWRVYNATNTTVTYSVYVKPAGRNYCMVAFSNNLDESWGIYVNLLTATFHAPAGTLSDGADWKSKTYSIDPCADGWVRISITSTKQSVNSTIAVNTGLHNGTSEAYAGDGTSGIYLWGTQLEAGAFPTSYIPTTTAAVTRAADVATMTGANFSSWYRQDEGSFVLESITGGNAASQELLYASDGTSGNSISMRYSSGSASQYAVTAAGVNQVSIAPSGYSTIGATYKRAASYKLNDFAQSINGSVPGVDTLGTVPAVTQINIGSKYAATSPINGHIKSVRYYPARISNSQLQALSAP